MERARPLCYVMDMLRRREEEMDGIERRPRVSPFMERGVFPVAQRENQEMVPGRNQNMARGRSRSYPAPPPNMVRLQPHSQPWCLTVGFGYVAPNVQFSPRLNSSSPHAPNPPHQLPFPQSLPQNQNNTKSTSSESSDSEDGDSLKANCGSP